MEDTSVLVWGVLFGGIGTGYFIYGKKQKNQMAFISGIALFMIPYFFTETWTLVASSVVAMALPFVIKL